MSEKLFLVLLSKKMSVSQSLAEKMFVWAEHSRVLLKEEQKRDGDGERGDICEGCLHLYSFCTVNGEGERQSPLEDIQSIRPSSCFTVLP